MSTCRWICCPNSGLRGNSLNIKKNEICQLRRLRHSVKLGHETVKASGSVASPSAMWPALGEGRGFAECQSPTGRRGRRSQGLRRVPATWHSAKNFKKIKPFLRRVPRGSWLALGEDFAECQSPTGRRGRRSHLPSSSLSGPLALGEGFAECPKFGKCSSPSAALGEAFAEYKVVFAECPRHSAKYYFHVVRPNCFLKITRI